MLTTVDGSATTWTVRGTTVPTLSEKFTLLTRGALFCASTVVRIWVRCSVDSEADEDAAPLGEVVWALPDGEALLPLSLCEDCDFEGLASLLMLDEPLWVEGEPEALGAWLGEGDEEAGA